MQKTNSAPEAKAEIERLEALKKRAAKQAAKRELPPEDIPSVVCTVLPLGDGKISMGEHIAGLGTVHYEKGETFPCPVPTAVRLYERGFVDFEGAEQAVAEVAKARLRDELADRAGRDAYEKLVALAGG